MKNYHFFFVFFSTGVSQCHLLRLGLGHDQPSEGDHVHFYISSMNPIAKFITSLNIA